MRRAVAVLLLALLGLAPTTAASGSDVVVVPGTVVPRGRHLPQLVRLRRAVRARGRRTEPLGRGRRRCPAGQPRHPAGDAGDRAGLRAGGPGRPGRRRRLVDVGPAGVRRAGRRPRLVRLLGARRGRGVVRPRRPGGHRRGVAAGPPRHRPVHLEPGRRRDRRGPRAGRRRRRSPASPGPTATGPATCWPASGATGRRSCSTRVATGATTYDLEGFPVSTTIAASAPRVAPGTEVTLTGATLDVDQRADRRAAGAGGAAGRGRPGSRRSAPQPVLGGADGSVVTTVTPERTTDYRWFQPATGYADAGWSPVVTVRVGR